MIRSELVQKVASDNKDIPSDQVDRIVDIFFDSMTDRLAKGGRVELRGFGVFSTRYREKRMGRNPSTGESVVVPAKKNPYFKAGKKIYDLCNKK